MAGRHRRNQRLYRIRNDDVSQPGRVAWPYWQGCTHGDIGADWSEEQKDNTLEVHSVIQLHSAVGLTLLTGRWRHHRHRHFWRRVHSTEIRDGLVFLDAYLGTNQLRPSPTTLGADNFLCL